MSRIHVIGAGHVGTSFAYAAIIRGLAQEIVLSDLNFERAEGEAMDLAHSVPFASPVQVRAGTLEDLKGSDIVVVTAGAKQRPGETRLDLAGRNVEAMGGMSEAIREKCPEAIVLVASNPVDVLTVAMTQFTQFPPHRVIGSGTILDTARLRHYLGKHVGVDPRNVHAAVLGEHGDSQFVSWSTAVVAGVSYGRYCELAKVEDGPETRSRIADTVRLSAYEVIKRKGATHYAIGLGLVRLTEAILKSQSSVLTVSCVQPSGSPLAGVAISLPCVISRGGVDRTVQIDLPDNEQSALVASADVIRETMKTAGL